MKQFNNYTNMLHTFSTNKTMPFPYFSMSDNHCSNQSSTINYTMINIIPWVSASLVGPARNFAFCTSQAIQTSHHLTFRGEKTTSEQFTCKLITSLCKAKFLCSKDENNVTKTCNQTILPRQHQDVCVCSRVDQPMGEQVLSRWPSLSLADGL